ncbi:MAG: hypothetical protein WD963_00880 [Candidatus Paceibacterota bacterium]
MDDPELKKLLEKNLALTEENNTILHSLRRSMRISRIISIIYWVFIIGSILGLLYFIQPYVDQFKEAYSGAKSSLEGFGAMFQGLRPEE